MRRLPRTSRRRAQQRIQQSGASVTTFCTILLTLCVALGQRMKQVPNRKQRETKNSTSEVEVVTDAMIRSPLHPRKQMECFEDMRKDDHDQTSSAEWL